MLAAMVDNDIKNNMRELEGFEEVENKVLFQLKGHSTDANKKIENKMSNLRIHSHVLGIKMII